MWTDRLKAKLLFSYLTSQLIKQPPQAFLLVCFLLRKAGRGRLVGTTRYQYKQKELAD